MVSLLVAGAVALLIWGAVMDGREDDRHRAGLERPDAATADLAGGQPGSGALDGGRLGTLAAG
ncbi:MAG: hypothetical protein M3Y04_06790 [Actinomycetota bacterium]|nr:hypothetical protein [Actinomycetota bacterium]